MKIAQISLLLLCGASALTVPLKSTKTGRRIPRTASKNCQVSAKATDNFDDSKYGVTPLSETNLILHLNTQGKYVTYTNTMVGSDASLNNLPPPSGHNWIGTVNGGIIPNAGYNAFHLYQWKYACTLATAVQGVNVIPSCKITITCTEGDTPGKKRGMPLIEAELGPSEPKSVNTERSSGDAKRQSFFYVPDGAAGLTGHFTPGNFDSDFQKDDLSSCSVKVDEASKMVDGASVPLNPDNVVALFDDIITSGVKCA